MTKSVFSAFSGLFILIIVCSLFAGYPQPQPGDVFREYTWFNVTGDAGGALRVGGRVDYGGGGIELPHVFDLEHATRAEVIIEKILCHGSTRGVAIQINTYPWILIPEADGIPEPQWEYQHHTYPVVAVPLAALKAGAGNAFKMKVDTTNHPWNWPQNLIYGVHFRIYYDPAQKAHPTGKLISPPAGTTIGQTVQLEATAHSPNGKIQKVDFIGHYEDVNFEGDGHYRQWHFHYFHGELLHHLGSAVTAPFTCTWNTDWVPEQPEPIQIAVRISDETGLIYFTEPVTHLQLIRPDFHVELCKPYAVPSNWTTRQEHKQEFFDITGDLSQAVAAQLVWTSWCPCYMNGIYINEQQVFDQEGPCYQYFAHRVTLTDLTPFRPGKNVLETGWKQTNEKGEQIHGMEIQWPGIMVLIRYQK